MTNSLCSIIYSYDIRSYHTLGLALTFNKTSVGCQYDAWFALSLPLQLEGSYDPTTSKLSLTHPLSLPVDVLHYHFLPHSFVVPFNRADMTPTQLANPGKFLYNDEEVAPVSDCLLPGGSSCYKQRVLDFLCDMEILVNMSQFTFCTH